jgi:hypothetical protein
VSPALAILVCRGCCCGTTRKHPDAAHEAQVESLRQAAAAAGARFAVTDCLGPCERSNVALVRTRREDGVAEAVWLGELLAVEETTLLSDWIRAGAHARAALPEALAAKTFRPSPEDAQHLDAVDSPEGAGHPTSA